MNKYKVNQYVEITDWKHGHGFKIGDIVMLTEENINNWEAEDEDGNSWFIEEDEFEFHSEPITKKELNGHQILMEFTKELLEGDKNLREKADIQWRWGKYLENRLTK